MRLSLERVKTREICWIREFTYFESAIFVFHVYLGVL